MMTPTQRAVVFGLVLFFAGSSSAGGLSRLTRFCLQCFELICPDGTMDNLFDEQMDFTLGHLRNYYYNELRFPMPCPEDVNDVTSWSVLEATTAACPPGLAHFPKCGVGRFKVISTLGAEGVNVTCNGRICGCVKEKLLESIESNTNVVKNATSLTTRSVYHTLRMEKVLTCDSDNCVKDVAVDKVDDSDTSYFGLIIGITAGVVVVLLIAALIGIWACRYKKARRKLRDNKDKDKATKTNGKSKIEE